MSNIGYEYGRSCRRPSSIVNQSVLALTISPRNRAMMTSKLSSIIRRCSPASIPSIEASDVSCPGPTPNIMRPSVRWSSRTMRSARISGWWYGSELTPVPSLIRFVRWAAAAMNTSGEAIVSNPLEWCSPIHASSNPRASRCSISCRSRLMLSVGFWPTGCIGGRKIPKRSGGPGAGSPT